MSVIPFAPPEKPDPHNTGEAVCLGCKHTWVASAPVGTTSLECPECTATKGIFKYLCEIKDEPHWECGCGNMLFSMTAKCIYCPNCGAAQQGF